MKILICDDDPTSLTKADTLLKKNGYETIAVEKSNEALRQLCSPHPPKMAVLDWVMPQYSGIDICKRVREQSTAISTYIIILTSKETPEDIETALNAGANDFIRKPLEPVEFRARIAAGVRIVSLEGELKTLTGMIRICSWCKKIHVDDNQQWMNIEEYVQDHSYARFTHGGCPSCIEKLKLPKNP